MFSEDCFCFLLGVFHKILNDKKSIPAIFYDFIVPAARVHSHRTIDMLPITICTDPTFEWTMVDLCSDI